MESLSRLSRVVDWVRLPYRRGVRDLEGAGLAPARFGVDWEILEVDVSCDCSIPGQLEMRYESLVLSHTSCLVCLFGQVVVGVGARGDVWNLMSVLHMTSALPSHTVPRRAAFVHVCPRVGGSCDLRSHCG